MTRLALGAVIALGLARGEAMDWLFYEENGGQYAAPEIRYRINGVSERAWVGVDSIHFGSSFEELDVRFAARPATGTVSLEPWPGMVNHFSGPTASWRRAIPAHRRLQYTSIAPSIDARFGISRAGDRPALTFAVGPGADVANLFLESSRPGSIDDAQGLWRILGPASSFRKPVAWQGSGIATRLVEASFVMQSSRRVTFSVATYDHNQPLFVEVALPLTLLDRAAIAGVRDGSNRLYAPADRPSDMVCSVNPGGGREYCPDAGVVGVAADGKPRFLTTLAGTYEDSTWSPFVLDRDGNLAITGRTGSSDFPVTVDAWQSSNAGPLGPFPRLAPPRGDLFLALIDSRDGNLLYSTFLGGPGEELANAIAPGTGSSIVLQLAAGKGFPVTQGAWLAAGGGVVAVFDTTLRRMSFATYLPEGFNVVRTLPAADGSIYFAGDAPDGLPATVAAIQPSYGGGPSDGYLLRLAGDGTKPLLATYFGGPSDDGIAGLTLAPDGTVWIVGSHEPGRIGRQQSFLAALRDDGRLAVAEKIIPAQFVSSFTATADGNLILLGAAHAAAAFTTPDATLRGDCGIGQPSGYFQIFRGDTATLYASYLPPSDRRTAPELYRDYQDRLLRPAPAALSLACVTNAADRRNTGRVSPGEVVTLVGLALGPPDGVSARPGADGRYPAELAGVRATVGGIAMPLLYVSAGQVNAIVPYGLTPGEKIDLALSYRETSTSVTLNTVAADFRLFSFDGSGSGHAAALNEDGSLNTASNPARRGSVVTVWGTGAGATTPSGADGGVAPSGPLEALPRPTGGLTANFLSYDQTPAAQIVYAGAAPGLVHGVTQINVRLPEQMPVTGAPGATLTFSAGGQSSPDTGLFVLVAP
ncbi:MAG: hypothetical protein R2729_21865 [Bryobacteraceae bacterium]